MGIKSMPSAARKRNVIRNTYFNQKYYDEHNIIIHPVFLLGTEVDPFGNKKSMPTSEENEFTDIIQTDITESHYALVHKDYELLKFFRDLCPQADFIYKGLIVSPYCRLKLNLGDDDIFLNPDKVSDIVHDMVKDEKRLIQGCVKLAICTVTERSVSFKYIFIQYYY